MKKVPVSKLDLGPLLTTQTEFSAIVQQVVKSKPIDTPRVDVLFLRYKEATPDENALAEVACYQVINYAIPKRKLMLVQKALAANPSDLSIISKLVAEAKSAFIAFKTDAKGDPQARYAEVGEVIAFCIACHHLSAGQVAAKMALKTNSEMPVFGLDGIHAAVDPDNILTVYFLESKMVEEFNAGTVQYVKSAGKFATDRKNKLNEQRIARDLSNLDILKDAAKQAALEYFNPYSPEQQNVRERFVGIIVYSEDCYADKIAVNDATPVGAHQKHFLEKFSKVHATFPAKLSEALKSENLEPGTCRAFYLAVPSVTQLKNLFAKEMSK